MKKYLNLVLMLVMAAALITSCKKKEESIPDTPPINVGGEAKELPYYQSFEESFGTYCTYNVNGEQVWTIDYSTAKMTGALKDSVENYINYDNEDWLISSPVKLTGIDKAKMVMSYCACYFNDVNNDVKIMVSENYTFKSDPTTATWTEISAELIGASGWDNFYNAEISLNDFIGKTVTVAVKYTSMATGKAGTIEIESISIEKGDVGNGGGGEIQQLPYFQSFATGFGTYGTKSIVGDQKWVIDFSTAKMAGSVKENGVYVNYDNEDWLISSPVAITGVDKAKMVMSYCACYFNNLNNDVKIEVSDNYVFGSDPTTATWNEVTAELIGASNWDNFFTAELSLNDFIGKTVTVAVKYTSNTVKAGTIEIQSISIEAGEVSNGGGGELQQLPYFQSFTTGFGTYGTKSIIGDQKWVIDFSTAKMAGSVKENGVYVNYDNEDWLISSPVAITGVDKAKMVMTYCACYFNNLNNDVKIEVSDNYVFGSDPTTATWNEVTAELIGAPNWDNFFTAEISLNDFIGKTVTVAVKYTSNTVKAGTIEIQSISIEAGEVSNGGGGEIQQMPYFQSFTTSFGTYTNKSVFGDQKWVIDFSTAKMAGSVKENGVYVNYDNEDWLISSPVAITGVDKAKLSMTYIACYFKQSLNSDLTIQVSDNYTFGEDPSTASWTQVPATWTLSYNWNTFGTTEVSLNDFVGRTVTVAVKYLSNTEVAGTIEIQSMTIEEGEASGGGTGGDPNGSGTEDDPYNVAAAIQHQGTDEIGWIEGYIVGCVKNGESTVNSNDQIDWSAPFSSFTNVVIADESIENNISNCVIVNLPSGSVLRQKVNLYDVSGNLGKVLEVNGKMRTYFGQAGLRDCSGDAASFYLDGVLGGGETPTPGGFFSETFAAGQGDFTIYDVVLPEGLTYVWSHAASYSCMRASAYLSANFATESWLISPAIDMSGINNATLAFDHAAKFGEDYPNTMEVMVSTNYNSGDPTAASWTKLNVPTYPDGSSWSFINSGSIDISSYTGYSNVRIAFKYTSTDSAASTWEVKNFMIQE